MDNIDGLVRLRADRDGSRYTVTFKPNAVQHWSSRPNGFTVELNEAEVRRLVGEKLEPYLAMARVGETARFNRKIPRTLYEKYADG